MASTEGGLRIVKTYHLSLFVRHDDFDEQTVVRKGSKIGGFEALDFVSTSRLF